MMAHGIQSELTPKQEGFAQDVAAGMSLSDAYRKHYDCSGYTDKSIWEDSSHLAANPKVGSRIRVLKRAIEDEALKDFTINPARLLQEAVRIATIDPTQITLGKPDLTHLSADERAVIKSIKKKDGLITEVQLWDKNAALQMLFRHKGLFEADNKQQGEAAASFYATVTGAKPSVSG